MNVQTVLPQPLEELPWTRITSEVNAWRGACIQSFAQAEAAVTETLLLLADAGARGGTVQLRHLGGQRLDDLVQALGPEGSFAAEGRAAFEALSAFRTHEGLRVHLAHDVARVALARNGTWIVVFRRLSIRSGSAERSSSVYEQHEAADALARLKRVTQRLDATLTGLRRVVELQPAG
ncbi:hypothetical protein [Sphingomonas aerolata]|uniref:hypothetical protein n=1 Tax=Sphingomonas aerolata TaxID=185951 RepID=UPI002FE13DE9